MATKVLLLISSLIWSLTSMAQPGQLPVSRVDRMPDQPAPYLMRNWKQVALKYDSFVYDVSKSGDYLPLTYLKPAGINYPQNPTFGMHTYVGTFSPSGNEAINVLPSLVGASLAGIDKSSQFGKDWVAMSLDFFNKANGENIYLNNAAATSGQDWWYDVMPNVYFYQLFDLYDGINAEADSQFIRIADRFTQAVQAMGWSETPWTRPFMNYRAWKFATMTPNSTGVPEPEAAGAIAWILYQAYQKTGNIKYRRAAEASLEFLQYWPSNPSYELQLPYGVLTAARMNAELGTRFDMPKMVNWCFDKGNLRGWGAITGTWGGVNVSGLIGEANDAGNDYAFQMNGMQQAGCLIPMVRYDKRYATAIGKWVLNLANASRFFYPGYLPSSKQDAAAWSSVYDKDQVIGYEALRQVWQGLSPFSTGDAKKGGWAATNLALYGTSSVGYLGACITTTEVEKILQLDLLATDFSGPRANPTFLYYNPYDTEKKISFQAGSQLADIYEMLSETFIKKGASGAVEVTIPARQSIVLVVCPAGGVITYDQNKMLVDGVVVDFGHRSQPVKVRPRIKSIAAEKNPAPAGKAMRLFCTAEDADSPQLTYQWTAEGGSITGQGQEVLFTAPGATGKVKIHCLVSDADGQQVADSLLIEIIPRLNSAPVILNIASAQRYAAPGDRLSLECVASDADGDLLQYTWKAEAGTIAGEGSIVDWMVPATSGMYAVSVTVTDSLGAKNTYSASWLVYAFDIPSGPDVASYPFMGNAQDQSGNQLHGVAKGAILTADRFSRVQQAYYFNGGAQSVQVNNHPLLNGEQAISVSTWAKPQALPERETFILSHGSWQNRWKLSITPERRLRWTINTTQGIADLDAPISLNTDQYYYITASFDGIFMTLYINGELVSFRKMSGLLRKTSLPLLMGQMLPDITTYNFKGTLDEVNISNFAATPSSVKERYLAGLSKTEDNAGAVRLPLISLHQEGGRLHVRNHDRVPGEFLYRIVAVSGQIMHQDTWLSARNMEIDISGWPSGLYSFQIMDGMHSKSQPFVIIR